MSMPNEATDKLAIAEQLCNYARAMDRIDRELGYAVWHPEGTARYGGMFEGTGRAFIDWVCGTHSQMIAHVHRISNRLGYIKTKTPDETESALRKKLPQEYWIEYNALLVTWGQNVCKPISPLCSTCPVKGICKRIKVGISR